MRLQQEAYLSSVAAVLHRNILYPHLLQREYQPLSGRMSYKRQKQPALRQDRNFPYYNFQASMRRPRWESRSEPARSVRH